ncbi:MAG: hypothetical protein WCF98_01480 [Synechococcus sp. ELA057]|jgi:hypothetical protein
MTAISTSPRPAIPTHQRKPASASADGPSRQQLEQKAALLYEHASRAAHEGDATTSARLILQALDCERRSGGSGPQVLQLIKPRG